MRKLIKALALVLFGLNATILAAQAGTLFTFKVIFPNWFYVEAIFLTAWACLLTGCAEETLFRYLLMDKLFTRHWKLPGQTPLVLSSIIFGAMHLFNAPWPLALPQAVWCVFGGLIWGVIYKRYGLGWAASMHALHNFMIFMLFVG